MGSRLTALVHENRKLIMSNLVKYPLIFCLIICCVNKVYGNTDLIEDASALHIKTQQLGFAWTTTAVLIEQAIQARKEGNEDLASALAQQAIIESQNSIKQAEFAEKHWQQSEP